MAQVVSEDKVTKPIRDWVYRQGWEPGRVWAESQEGDPIRSTGPKRNPFWKFLEGVVECYRCSGVWLSILATFMVQARWPWTGGWNGIREFVVVMFAASITQFALMTFVYNAQNEPDMLEDVAKELNVTQNYYTRPVTLDDEDTD